MRFYSLLLGLMLSLGTMAQTTYYVSTSGSATNDGLSWATAKNFIKNALTVAQDGDIIKVAKGTYVDGAAITVTKSVTIKGGYDPETDTQDYDNPSELTRLGGNGRIMSFSAAGKTLTLENLLFASGKSDQGAALQAVFTVMQNTDGIVISRCRFSNNTSTTGFGGAIMAMRVPVKLSHCIFSNNTTATSGAVFLKYGAAEVINCLFSNNNSTDDAGALYYYGTSLKVVNSTFVGNRATDASKAQGGAIALFSDANVTSNIELSNSILWGNTAAKEAGQVYALNDIQIQLTSNIIQGGRADILIGARAAVNYTTDAATDASDTDPLFEDAAAEDYRLKSNSTAIDAGNDDKATDITTDLSGKARKSGTAVDLGVYEYDPTATSINAASTASETLHYDVTTKTLHVNRAGIAQDVLSIYQVNGSLLRNKNLNDTIIYVGDLPSGIYIVKVGNAVMKLAL